MIEAAAKPAWKVEEAGVVQVGLYLRVASIFFFFSFFLFSSDCSNGSSTQFYSELVIPFRVSSKSSAAFALQLFPSHVVIVLVIVLTS